MKERNKYIILGFIEFNIVIVGLLIMSYFDNILAMIMLPFFVLILLIDFKLLNMILKKIKLEEDKGKLEIKEE